jgi:hypothetical protein
VTDLVTPVFGPERLKFPAPEETSEDLDAILAKSEMAVVDPTCPTVTKLKTLREFTKIVTRKWTFQPRGKKGLDLYIRKVPGSAEAPSEGDSKTDDELLDPHIPDEGE